MKKNIALISSVFMLLLISFYLVIPVNFIMAEAPGGHSRVICYKVTSNNNGSTTYSVYHCGDCSSINCNSYETRDLCDFTNSIK